MNKNNGIHDNRVIWQIDCDNTIKEKNNVILSSPTGSGKTGRYEIWALEKTERPIFITSPIKALSNQKFRDLQARGYKVGLETGDIRYIPHNNCDIICCTQEIYNNKYRNCRNSTLIIDEFSYIFDDEERARVYIDSLQYSSAKNIMICSATFGNPKEIEKYISKLTRRDFFLYENKERLTTLEYKGSIQKKDIKDSLVVAYSKNACQMIAKDIYQDRIDKISTLTDKTSFITAKSIINNRKEILEIAKKYKINNQELIELSTLGVTYYYGNLYPKEKLFIEELFEKRLIDTVVGTDALALGVNFPIKNVIFTQLVKRRNKVIEEISKNLFEQLSGRAGRKGYFENGYVYYCEQFSHILDNINPNSLEQTFYKLVNAENETFEIDLNANINEILLGNTTIDEETKFITKFSTIYKDYEEEKIKICKIIDYITSFELSTYYLKEIYHLDLKQGFYKSMEHLNEQTQIKIEKLSEILLKLQPYFDKDIKLVYLNEYSPKQNCIIFMDILLETSIEKLIQRYGKTLYDLLILRKYMHRLPSKYSKIYNLKKIDNMINNMDYTVLHPNEFNINKKNNNNKRKIITMNKKNYNYPQYLDKISIKGKLYVKVSIDNKGILVCEYNQKDSLNLHYIPLNTIYIIKDVIKQNEMINILNRININSLLSLEEDTIDKIEGMKLSLKKKH